MPPASEQVILLVVPPFQTTSRPSLGAGQLHAILRERGFNTRSLYLNLGFAERIGLDLYESISDSTYNALLGEFIFSDLLFEHSDQEIDDYVKQVLQDSDLDKILTRQFPREQNSKILRRLMQQASSFCDRAIEEIRAFDPWMVGLASSFQQNCSSLAMIRRLKATHPEIVTVMGGANCEAEMGEELFRRFPEIDYIGQGECDHSFPDLVQSLVEGSERTSVPGFLSRGGASSARSQTLGDDDLERLPHPDFHDYFEQLNQASFRARVFPGLPMETSRGCWWGEKHHCLFCGLNGEGLGFRTKSWSRAKDELAALVKEYDSTHVWMADNIMDMKYFRSLLPELAEEPMADIFYETKSNLTRSQVQLLARARINWIQPGIESLSDHSLDLMKKGTSRIQNLQLLKWCGEFGIWVGWNYLFGFPGEDANEALEIARDFDSLHHLQPPSSAISIRVDRFSPYFSNPGQFGLEPLSVGEPYRHVFPFPEDSLERIAYFKRSPHFDEVRKSDTFRELGEAVETWKKASARSFLLAIPRHDSLVILDTRSCAGRRWHSLRGVQRKVYELCDKAQSLRQLREVLAPAGESELQSILESFVSAKLMIESNGRYLSLAIDARPNCGKPIRPATGGFVAPMDAREKRRRNLDELLNLELPLTRIQHALGAKASHLVTKLQNMAVTRLTRALSGVNSDESIERVTWS